MNAFKCKLHLQKIFMDSLSAVNPVHLIEKALKIESGNLHILNHSYKITKNIYLIGFGKAVLGMASASEKILSNHLKGGIICVPEKIIETLKDKPEFHLKKNSVIKVFEGAKNNLPDENAEKGAEAVLNLIKNIDKNDLLLVLISGGGSALLPKPKKGVALNEKLSTIKLVASSGASINELNTIRKRLSSVKGGKLAEMSYPTKTIALILSDVINNPLDIIASGPTVPNLDEEGAALNIIRKYELTSKIPKSVLKACESKLLKSDIPVIANNFAHVNNFLIGHNQQAIDEGKNCAERLGFACVVLSNKIEGLAKNLADFYSDLCFEICKVLQTKDSTQFVMRMDEILNKYEILVKDNFKEEIRKKISESKVFHGLCIIGGGEPTVLVQGTGKGGRNQELALAFSKNIHSLRKNNPKVFDNYECVILSGGTDGIDGPTDAAGAIGSFDVIDIALKNNLNPDESLLNNDSYNFYKKIENGSYLIKTGHTGTNVMDLHVLLICRNKKSNL